jgi:hypothetical protein
VSFRTIDDEDDVLRTDSIDYLVTQEYGFVLESDNFGFYDDEFDEEEELFDEKSKIELDEDELISFLNEYYEINPKSLPRAELY